MVIFVVVGLDGVVTFYSHVSDGLAAPETSEKHLRFGVKRQKLSLKLQIIRV